MIVKLLQPENASTVSLLSSYHKAFLKDPAKYAKDRDLKKTLGVAPGDGSVPQSVSFRWEPEDEEHTFILSDTPDFSNIIERRSCKGHCEVINLRFAQTYYWRVGDSEVGAFTTEYEAPRLISFPDMWNARDIGGWKTTDGRRVKQGMVYRGSEIYGLSDESNAYMRDIFGIRCELDLRAADDHVSEKSTIDPDVVRYMLIHSEQYEVFIARKDLCKQIFDVFLDPDNYPMYIHCVYGADRTGTVCAMLEAVLGLSKEDVLVEYELTSLIKDYHRNRDSEEVQKFLAALKPYGETFADAVRSFLHSCGITDDDMDKIRSILLEN